MSAREIFGIVVRTVGLLLLVGWIFAFLLSVRNVNREGVLWSCALFAISGYLLRGAPLLVDWSFEESDPRAARRPSSPQQS